MKSTSTNVIVNDDEDVVDLDQRFPPTGKSARLVPRHSEPRIIDWNPSGDETAEKRGRFGRRKTAPNFESAPSHQRPIFSGRTISKLPTPVSSNWTLDVTKNETNPLKSSQIQIAPTYSDFDPIVLIQRDIKTFVSTAVPENYLPFVQCSIRRDREGFQKNLSPTFYLHAERPSDGKKFLLLAAKKIPKVNRTTKYVITTSIETLSEKSHSDGYVGKLRGNNLLGTDYTLYDNGIGPDKFKSSVEGDRTGLRRELTSIIYNTNVLGFKGPRQMNVVVPKTDEEVQPAKNEDTLLDRYHQRKFSSLLQLRNRPPRYDKEEKSYMLEFTNNRVGPSSVKNFQLIMETDKLEERVVMQFGRINDDTFTCDYRHPLTALQAFGIALSAFDSRVTRE